ncbi:hypothetical protein [Candidatus Albibeggiatoa sp. nov. NOAA]|uniref:hypothetical protein n=1 Tax=Candidatus Albibeggiatoa sp. nov. NOAA TaxID=3162724 RepID=UPI00330136C2|nr:hypothetical protein [Thiotrichaceae bacterium]
MAKKDKKKLPMAYNVAIVISAILVMILVYKQVYLGSQITSQLPQPQFTQSIESCLQEHIKPTLLKSLTAQSPVVKNSFVDVNTLLNTVLKGLSSSMVDMKITQNYITEMKLLKVEDFFGNNAQVRMTGMVEIESSAPMVGSMDNTKEYTTTVYKRGDEHYFKELSVKERDEANWEQWRCAKTF